MNFDFSEEQKLIKKTISEFAQREIKPIVDKMEKKIISLMKL